MSAAASRRQGQRRAPRSGVAPGVVVAAAVAALAATLPAAAPSRAAPADLAAEIRGVGDAYRAYLGEALTPVRSTGFARRTALGRGFREASIDEDRPYAPGEKIFFSNDDRSVFLVVIGAHPALEGLRLVGAHQDTPSLMLEPFPLRAPKGSDGLAHLIAHGYGGIKSYHYAHRPLGIVGDVRRAADGARVAVALGFGADGFAFSATALDTDPKWDDKPPEWKPSFKIVAASMPSAGSGVKAPLGLTVLRALYDRFKLGEKDLGAARLYVVPAEGPRDVGLDRMIVGGWGQDDRLNSYATLRAVTGITKTPPWTAVGVLVDREEIGSSGTSGMRGEFLDRVVARLVAGTGGPGAKAGAAADAAVRTALAASRAISADTPAAVDPIFPEIYEEKNAARLGRGPALYKFTGRGGKSGGSDADPATVARVLRIFAAAGVPFQTTELGRVDEGGGGT
ncbi:MAG TPA: hypothetical protein VG389_24250, partial [Myxococcota bacterium]|nr:hypothetical protein [Myxococcota bacterium]